MSKLTEAPEGDNEVWERIGVGAEVVRWETSFSDEPGAGEAHTTVESQNAESLTKLIVRHKHELLEAFEQAESSSKTGHLNVDAWAKVMGVVLKLPSVDWRA